MTGAKIPVSSRTPSGGTRRRPSWLGVGAAVAAGAVVVGAAPLSTVLALGTAAAAATLGPSWYRRRAALGSRQVDDSPPARLGELPGRESARIDAPGEVRRVEVPASGRERRPRLAASTAGDMVERYLTMVRDSLDVDEVTLWRWMPPGDSLRATAWSAAAAQPPRGEPGPLVLWAARERLVVSSSEDAGSLLIAAPVEVREQPFGALSALTSRAYAKPREEAKHWLARHAAHVGALLGLLKASAHNRRAAPVESLMLEAEHAIEDAVTGLASRRAFEERLAEFVAESNRFGRPVALLIIEIAFSNAMAHPSGRDVGDRVLHHAARIVQHALRVVDKCARYGRDELAVLLPQTDLGAACEVAERLRAAILRRPVSVEGTQIAIIPALGVAAYPQSAPSPEGLCGAAERALSAAKKAGRNCVQVAGLSRATTVT